MRKITFTTIRPGIRRNTETGIEIHQVAGGFDIFRTLSDGTLSYWGSERTSGGARALATERVEQVREELSGN